MIAKMVVMRAASRAKWKVCGGLRSMRQLKTAARRADRRSTRQELRIGLWDEHRPRRVSSWQVW